ncbi:hypothetical protein MCUN1_002942 [Malassezia cuniculi]|uniref:Amino acid transporter transmembrane domain-containing protein n=1 Tax=Malassezia cuniculi TaxID=948313 RepID=A0AAF0EXF2_9BASI|nr:hypothetical protein MCUN1_002942 [Malassezia cuniculi]
MADASYTRPPGHATVLSSVSNLTNTIIGAGMLALPHAFASTGWLLGSLLILLCAVTTAYGLHLVKRCEQRLGFQATSFYDMTLHAMPKAAWWFDLIIVVKCYGVGVSYLLICSHLMPQVVLSFAHAFGSDRSDVHGLLMSSGVWSVIFVAALSPLCFLRRLNSLRGVGYVNIVAVAYLLLIMIVYALSPELLKELPTGGDARAIVLSPDILKVFPVIVFAYTCAQNIIPVYNELEDDSASTADQVVGISIGISALVYLVVAIVGYFSFGSFAPDNIISMYPDTSLFVCFGKLSVIFLTLTSYPLQLYPCRGALNKVLYPPEIRLPTEEEGERSSLVNVHQGHSDDPVDFPNTRWNIMTVAIMISGVALSLVVRDLSLVLGVVGSFGSTAISFILPALLYTTLYPDKEELHYKAAKVLGLWGVVVMALTVSMNIARLFM